jgi:hypothetical protein
MVESGRKHGPFDFRYPVRRKIATPVWELQRGHDGHRRLEWSAFLARFFPNRRRHDFKALAAYEAYRDALDRAASPQPSAPMPSTLAGEEAQRGVISALRDAEGAHAASRTAVAVRTVSSSSALADWESEGGSVVSDFD